MIEFEATGPYKISIVKSKGGRGIEKAEIEIFKKNHASQLLRAGVYVFCISASGTYVPWYVGKATKSFSQECFTPSKIEKYNQTIRKIAKGLPVLFFVSPPKRQGKVPAKLIGEIERELIKSALANNENLLNVHHNKKSSWSIKGVVRSGRGQPTIAEKALRKALLA